jgi:hypothetical protein
MNFGVLTPGKLRCETSCHRTSQNPDLRNPETSLVYIYELQSFISQEAQIRDLLSSHIAKSQLAKPQNELSIYI